MRRDRRLHKKAEFDAVFSTNVRISRRELSVAVRDRGDDQPNRWGFAVSSRLGGSVVRNKIKRRLRAAAMELDGTGFDVVVIARRGAAEAPYAALADNLGELMRRARQRLDRGGES